MKGRFALTLTRDAGRTALRVLRPAVLQERTLSNGWDPARSRRLGLTAKFFGDVGAMLNLFLPAATVRQQCRPVLPATAPLMAYLQPFSVTDLAQAGTIVRSRSFSRELAVWLSPGFAGTEQSSAKADLTHAGERLYGKSVVPIKTRSTRGPHRALVDRPHHKPPAPPRRRRRTPSVRRSKTPVVRLDREAARPIRSTPSWSSTGDSGPANRRE